MNNSPNFQATIDWYSQNAEKYAQWVDDYYSSEQITTFISMLPQQAKILDAGCGSGRDTKFFTNSGFDATGLDAAEGMIKTATRNNPNSKFVVGDFRQLQFPDNTFQGVWSHASLINLETVQEVQLALKEFYRVLAPEGILHALVKLQVGEHKVILSEDKESNGKRIVHYFQEDEFKALLQQAGFTPIIVETYTEDERNPRGRPNVSWIHTLSKKA